MGIEEIIEIVPLEEELRDNGVDLRKKGVNYIGLCPFHREKTPSFIVSPVKKIAKCFGCGVGGNVITLVSKLRDISFKETIFYLSKKYGIPIEQNLKKEAEEYQKRRDRKVELINFLKIFEAYFQRELEKNPEIKNYLKERNISADSIKRFHLGWAPKNQEAFLQHYFTREQQEGPLQELGMLLNKKSPGDILVPRFNNRLMIPIYDWKDELVAFGGRVVNNSSKTQAKYLNSPESELFKKHSVLYGLTKETIKLISQYDRVILVEGYMDVIQAWEQGIPQNGWPVIATMGTSLTENQLNLIKRFTKNVYIMDDGDEAGLNAINRSIPLLMSVDLNPNVFIMPEGKDPDDIFKEQGMNFLKQNTAKDFYDFKKFFFEQKLDKPFTEFSTTEKYDFLESTLENLMANPNLSKNFMWVNRFKEDFEEPITLQAYSDLFNKSRSYQKGFQEEVRNSFLDFNTEQKLIITYLYSDVLQREEIKRRYVNKMPLSSAFKEAIQEVDNYTQKLGIEAVDLMRFNEVGLDRDLQNSLWLFLSGYRLESLKKENMFPTLKLVDLAVNEKLFEIALDKYSIAKQRGNIEETKKYLKVLEGLSNGF